MSIHAQVDGIGTLEFPDGTDPAVIQSTVTKMVESKGSAHPDFGAPKSDKVDPALEVFGLDESALQVTSGMAGAAVGGLAGISQGLQNTYDRYAGNPVGMSAADRVESVQDAMTYKPRTESGKMISGAIAAPANLLAKGGDMAGQVAADVTGSPAVGAAVNTAVQSIPGLFGAKLGVAGKAASAPGTGVAQAAAKAYAGRIGLDWNALAVATRETLTKVAAEAKNLDKLDPAAVKRVARAQAIGAPISRGRATRDLEQLTHEENISKSAFGKPLREQSVAQDVALHGALNRVRPASQVETRSQLGESVQGAQRAKLRSLEADYRLKYRKAKQGGETASPVDSTPLSDWLDVPANKRNAGFLRAALDDYKKDASGSIRINDLEEVRKEANVKAGSMDKTEAHYAKEAVKVIDKILDDSGGDAYKSARKAFAKTRDEFDRQGLVSKLTKEKGRTNDRAVALEDTFDTVVRQGSNEQLKGLLDSLTKGGTPKTKAAGAQAVKDLQAATVDYLKEKAAGKRAVRGEDEQLEFNPGFIEAVDELDKDGKLSTLFGPKGTEALRELRQVTRDLRTKPSARIAGSDTASRLVAIIAKLSHVPGLSTVGTIVKAGAQKLHEVADARAAAVNPLDKAAASASKEVKRKNTLQDLRTAAPSASSTLQDHQ